MSKRKNKHQSVTEDVTECGDGRLSLEHDKGREVLPGQKTIF